MNLSKFRKSDIYESLVWSIQAMGLRLLGSGLAFLFTVALARSTTVQNTGIYYIGFSILILGSIISRIGIDVSLVKFVARLDKIADEAIIRRLRELSIKQLLKNSLLVTVLMIGCVVVYVSHSQTDGNLNILFVFILAILPFSILQLNAEYLRGLRSIPKSLLCSGILVPLISLLLIFLLVHTFGSIGVAYTFLLSSIFACGVSHHMCTSATVEGSAVAHAASEFNELKNMGKEIVWIIVVNRMVFPWLPVIIIGAIAGPAEAGVYAILNRLSNLISLFLSSVNNVMAPKFAHFFANEYRTKLIDLSTKMASLVMLGSLPILAILILNSIEILSIFGSEYIIGSDAFIVLLASYFISTLCGSPSTLLMMTGFEKSLRQWTNVCAIFLVLSTILLTYAWGHFGAALAFAFTFSLRDIGSVILVKKKLNYYCIPNIFITTKQT